MPTFWTLFAESVKQRMKRLYYATVVVVIRQYNKRNAGKGKGWWSDE